MNNQAKKLKYSEIVVGQKSEFEYIVSKANVKSFAELSGDKSPIHTDDSYALTTEYKTPIAHGMLIGGLFSRLVGMELPGVYAIYLSQTLSFHHPVYPGDSIVISGEVIQKSDATKTISLRTEAKKKDSGKLLVGGTALVRVLS